MNIRVQFYSHLRDLAGASELSIDLPDKATVGDLLTEIYEKLDANIHRRGSGELSNQFPSEYTNIGKVAILFHKIESVTDYKLVFDFKADVICIDLPCAFFLFAKQNANADAARVGCF